MMMQTIQRPGIATRTAAAATTAATRAAGWLGVLLLLAWASDGATATTSKLASAPALTPAPVPTAGSAPASAPAQEPAPQDPRQMGLKYSALEKINTANVKTLQVAWEYHTGEPKGTSKALVAFEDEPTLIDGNLIICTTARRLIALDPATGQQRWIYDPKTDPAFAMKKCRGITTWVDRQASREATCRTRIFLGTADYRLVAIDVRTGQPCADFGEHGQIQMPVSKPEIFKGEVSGNSRPAVIGDVVVVGSTVADDQRVDAPSGRVLAYDARSGKARWEFDPLPRSPTDPAASTWLKGSAGTQGGGNVWSEMAADENLGLVYLPTTSPAVDFYGAHRPGANAYADSIVALKAATGEVAWSFQFVHHNLWDYDTPAQPLLVDLPYNGKSVPALIQNTKTGMIFIFDRKTGEPLIPYVERPVPQQGAVPGEWLSPTQPFPIGMPVLAATDIAPEDAWGFTYFDRKSCANRISELNHGPIYTPPSLKGTVLFPAAAGGPNWGGGAYDPKTHIMVVPSSRVPMIITLVPREQVKLDPNQAIETRGPMYFPSMGTPYVTKIEPLLSSWGAPCTAPPWAVLTAVDLVTGEKKWEVPLGSIDKMAHLPFSWELGTPGAGGPLVTAGGLVFIGYTLDDRIRAFDLRTGETLWKAPLPAAGMATPVTYEVNGEQYVVLTAGGHSMYGSTMGDSVMAFKLPH